MEEHNSWAWVAKGKKILLVVDFILQAKFVKENIHHTKEVTLRFCGLPKTNTVLQDGHTLIHDTLELKNITLEKAWTTLNNTLLI